MRSARSMKSLRRIWWGEFADNIAMKLRDWKVNSENGDCPHPMQRCATGRPLPYPLEPIDWLAGD